MLWRLLALGGLPATALFKTVHVLFGLALVAVTRRGVLRLGRSPAMADALAALLAGGVVLVQLGLYAAVYFLTYVSPEGHILSSFTRIAAALVPLGMLGIASSGYTPAWNSMHPR